MATAALSLCRPPGSHHGRWLRDVQHNQRAVSLHTWPGHLETVKVFESRRTSRLAQPGHPPGPGAKAAWALARCEETRGEGRGTARQASAQSRAQRPPPWIRGEGTRHQAGPGQPALSSHPAGKLLGRNLAPGAGRRPSGARDGPASLDLQESRRCAGDGQRSLSTLTQRPARAGTQATRTAKRPPACVLQR